MAAKKKSVASDGGGRRARKRDARIGFEALSIEGGLLSPDWLARIAQLGAQGQTEADYRVPRGLTLRDEIGRYWRIAQAHWSDFSSGRKSGADAGLLAQRFVVALVRQCFGFESLEAVAPIIIADRTYPIGHAALRGRAPVVVAAPKLEGEAAARSALDEPRSAYGDATRKRSPFGLVQEYLNAQESALWGLVSDGLTLRIVRDNASLTRPAWIEADLARIFAEERYADFAALWLLVHESRFGGHDQPMTACTLEAWRSEGREEGTRAREQLRRGVEEALRVLGQGFVSHPANQALRAELEGGETAKKDFFNQLLRLVYRVIFLLTVEERGVLHAAGPYRCPVVRVRGRVVATNHPPHGAFRGFGAPQTTFAYERQMQKLAIARGEDPLALRKRLALRSGDTTATGQLLGFSVGTDEVIAAIENVAGEVPARDGTGPTGAPVRRGRGVCFYFHGAGFTGSGEQRLAGRATVALTTAGMFEVRSSSTDIGQGSITMFTQIAASALGVDAAHVSVIDPSTANVPDSGPTVASRTCMVVGSLVDQGSRALVAQLQTWAADNGLAGRPLMEIAKARSAHGELTHTVQYEPPPGIEWNDATYTGSAYPVYGWAACLVDVSVDVDTYEVTIDRCVQAVDVGKAINPSIVKGQIEGGTLQALGWAVLENVVYKDGKVANANMTNCIVPTFADAPDLETILVEVPYPFGPSGAKGVGEIPMDGPAAAVANAVENALGVAFDRLPISPESIAAKKSYWRTS